MGEIGDFLNKGDIILKIFSNNRCNRSTDYNVNPSDIVLSMGDDYMFAISMQEVNFSESPSYNVTFEYRDYQLLKNGTKILNKILIDLQPCTLDHWKNLGHGVDWEMIYN